MYLNDEVELLLKFLYKKQIITKDNLFAKDCWNRKPLDYFHTSQKEEISKIFDDQKEIEQC